MEKKKMNGNQYIFFFSSHYEFKDVISQFEEREQNDPENWKSVFSLSEWFSVLGIVRSGRSV